MKIKISKEFPYQFLFALCIMLPYINIYEITFFVWMITILITIKKTYSRTLFNYIYPFLAILFIAFIVGVQRDYQLFVKIRDITYLVKPILGLLVGYQLCRTLKINPIKTIIFTGVLLAVVHLAIVFNGFLVHNMRTIHNIRTYSGYFSDYEVYAFIFLIFSNRFNIIFSKKEYYSLFLILGISVLFYFSRTNFIQLAILYFVLKGYFTFNKRTIAVLSVVVLISGIGYTYIYNMNLKRNGHGLEALLYKIKNAPIEPFKTKVDKDDWEDFNDNYRSFENIMTIRQVRSEGTTAVLFGKGMGATMRIGKRMRTNDGTYIRNAPTLHNAYATVFLKSGLLGVFFSFLAMYYMFKNPKTDDLTVKTINQVLVATGLTLILANWVLLGLYLKYDNKSIIIGFLLAFRELHSRNQKIIGKGENE